MLSLVLRSWRPVSDNVSEYGSRGGWTAPCKTSWEICARFHAVSHSYVHCCEVNISVRQRNMEAFERQDCQATIGRENSMIYIYCCDPYYDKAFTIPSLPFLRLHVIYCHFCFLDKPSREELALFQTSRLLFQNWMVLNLLVLSV